MKTKVCAICGRYFVPDAPRRLCCGPECTKEYKRRARQKWETESGYKEKMQARRDQIRKGPAGRSDPKAGEAAAVPARTGGTLESGPALEYGPLTPEYWSAWREMDLKRAKEAGRRSASCVNGISVNDPDFIDKVLISIEERGAVMISCGLERNGE